MNRPEKKKIVRTNLEDGRGDSLLWFESKKRIRNVDFHRIENNPNQDVLTPFELEVKSKLASVPSPYHELARLEDEEHLAKTEQSLKTRLGILVSKAKLTAQQRVCYEFLYVQKLPELEILKRMGITQVRLSQLQLKIEAALRRAYQKQQGKSQIKRKRGVYALTPKQKEILRLHEREGLSFEEIARRFGLSRQTIHEIYRGGLNKF